MLSASLNKTFPSLNVEVICDAKVKWTNLVARRRGSAHDNRILRSSTTWDITENGHTGGYTIGDSGYLYLPYVEPQYSKRRFLSFFLFVQQSFCSASSIGPYL